MFNKFITPNSFEKVAKFLLPLASALFVFLLPYSLYVALVSSPADYQQGETVRIMYIHVPSAWLALSIYTAIALCGISYLVWRNSLSAIFMKSLISIGMAFCFICLVTGSLWGRPVWGVYWVWDARLTSMLVLLFLYIGLYLFYNSHENEEKAYKLTSILAIIGIINLPIIKFSVDWWNTLHQPASLTKLEKPSLHIDIMTPLLLMFVSFLLFTLILFIIKVKRELIFKKIDKYRKLY